MYQFQFHTCFLTHLDQDPPNKKSLSVNLRTHISYLLQDAHDRRHEERAARPPLRRPLARATPLVKSFENVFHPRPGCKGAWNTGPYARTAAPAPTAAAVLPLQPQRSADDENTNLTI
ncbi:S-adenosyl-L-methionine-dependent methyltransferase [Apiospora arundinis]